MGEKIRDRYKTIFPEGGQFDREKHFFCSSDVPRARESGAAFVEGLLGSSKIWDEALETPRPENKDYVLRFFEACPRYHNATQQKGTHLKWVKKAKKTFLKNQFISIKIGIKKRHGIELTLAEIKHIWTGCKEDTIAASTTRFPAISRRQGRSLLAPIHTALWGSLPGGGEGWCEFLSHEDRVKLEYATDLKHHRKVGYGNPMKSITVRPLLDRIISEIDYMASEEGKGTGLFWFTHTEAIIPLLVSLGLYHDLVGLDAERQPEDILNRKFRSSRISPFAGHVEFLTYTCDKGQKYVRVVHNEQEVRLPWCSMKVYCPLGGFLNGLRKIRGNVEGYIKGCQMTTSQAKDFRENRFTCNRSYAPASSVSPP